MRLIRFGVPGVIVKVPTCNSSFTPLMKNLQMKTYMCLCRLHFISVSQFKCEMWLIPAHSLFLITFQGCHSVVCNVLTWKSFFFFFFFRISFTFYVHLLSRNTFFRSHFDFFFFFFSSQTPLIEFCCAPIKLQWLARCRTHFEKWLNAGLSDEFETDIRPISPRIRSACIESSRINQRG